MLHPPHLRRARALGAVGERRALPGSHALHLTEVTTGADEHHTRAGAVVTGPKQGAQQHARIHMQASQHATRAVYAYAPARWLPAIKGGACMHSCTHIQHCMLHAHPHTQPLHTHIQHCKLYAHPRTQPLHAHTYNTACISTHTTAAHAHTHIQHCMHPHTTAARTGIAGLAWLSLDGRCFP